MGISQMTPLTANNRQMIERIIPRQEGDTRAGDAYRSGTAANPIDYQLYLASDNKSLVQFMALHLAVIEKCTVLE